MKHKYLFLLGVLLALCALCAAALLLFGRTYTLRLDETRLTRVPESTEGLSVELGAVQPCAAFTGMRLENGALELSFRGFRRGSVPVTLLYRGEDILYCRLYVHPFGVITFESFFGDCAGDFVFPLAAVLFLLALLAAQIKEYRAGLRHSLYSYRNVLRLGLIIFLTFLTLDLIPLLFGLRGLEDLVKSLLDVFRAFSGFVLPVTFVLSILLTVSNLGLMRREGRTPRNMLGILLGAGLLALTLLPFFTPEYLQRINANVIDVHNQRGAALYIEIFVEAAVSALAAYLECVLAGTVYFAVRAARHTPAFDKDYILILGCQILPDGSLTPLLRSRADKALEFARMQKEKTGKDIVFVPSGGQGPDEPLPEAAAIGTYLESIGVPRERILTEEASVNTSENIRNSMALIRRHAGEASPKVAFSTTNYHVFRAGLLAQAQGESLEGIGSPTKRYFWVNAFIREFMATLVSERKRHALMFLLLNAAIALMVAVEYLSVVL